MAGIHNPLLLAKEGEVYSGIARIMSRRLMGKICFCNVRFLEAQIQILLTPKLLQNYDELIALPSGSLIRLEGRKMVTRTGMSSIEVTMASPLYIYKGTMPDKWHGLGYGIRYRKRTEDMLTNISTFDFFKKISLTTEVIRRQLYNSGYKEFNTGVLQRSFEAGQAKPFSTICNATQQPMYLSLTSELKLKRLIIAGFEKVFEIAQSFRNEGIDAQHSPEFSMLELYAIDCGCEEMIELLESLVSSVVSVFNSGATDSDVEWFLGNTESAKTANYAIPFMRITFKDLFEKHIANYNRCSLDELVGIYPSLFSPGMSKFTWLMKVIEKIMVPQIGNPTFITQLPSGMSPLIRRSRCGQFSERAFFVSQGIFLADLYQDENDQLKLQEALETQAIETGNPVSRDFIETIQLGMPPTAGIGLGLNRLFMLFLGHLPNNIKETILNPIL